MRSKSAPLFQDRAEAGRKLAAALAPVAAQKPIVLALPRGGVPVAFEIATALKAPLDVLLVRKIGAPGQPELGLGAVVDGAAARTVWNEEILRLVSPGPDYLENERARQLQEIERRRALYRGDRQPLPVRGRLVILVDDGVATGGTVGAALEALRQEGLTALVLAVPVAPRETLEALGRNADAVVCLATPEPFLSVGSHYRDFTQTEDSEVIELLHRAAAAASE